MSVWNKYTLENARHFNKTHWNNQHCDPNNCSEIIPNDQLNEMSIRTLSHVMHLIISFLQVNKQSTAYLPKSMFIHYVKIPIPEYWIQANIPQVKSKMNQWSKEDKITITSESDNAFKYLTSIYFTIIGTNVSSMFHRLYSQEYCCIWNILIFVRLTTCIQNGCF